MQRSQVTTLLLLGIAVVLGVCGCNQAQDKESTKQSAGTPEADKEQAAKKQPGADEAAPADDAKAAEINAELAKLSPEDRELAKAQRICPVSREPLGSMGVPIKVTVDGKSLFVCCDGCEKNAKANFEKHYAKIHGE